MRGIGILPIGSIEEKILSFLSQKIASRLGYGCRIMPSKREPVYAFDPKRRQYSSGRILREILNSAPEDVAKVVGIVNADLCTPILSFIFGEAQLGGRAAIVSLCRLRQEYYGLPPNPALLLERVAKETLHEIGHTFGLTHCSNSECVMYFSNSIANVDVKTDHFCSSCSILLSDKKRGL